MFIQKKVFIVNNINRTKSTIFFALAISLALVAAAFLSLAVITEYESILGHFMRGAMFAPAVYVTCGVGFACGIASLIFFRRTEIDSEIRAGVFPCFTHALTAFMTVAAIVFDYLTVPAAQTASEGGVNIISIAYYIFAVGTCAAFLMYGFSGAYKSTAAKLLSFCPVIYCAVKTLMLYFDKSIAVNGPLKIMCQLAYVSLMLMLVYDSGLAVGKEKIFGKSYMCTLWAVVMSGAVSVSSVAAHIMNVKSFELSLAETCLLTAFFLTALSKLWHLSFKLISVSEDEEQ